MIVTKPLREQVYEYLKEKINSGDLKKGGIIDLTEISKSLNISKTPLRDALIMLESEGFVEILPRKGVRVKPLTLENIKNIYQMIGWIECGIIMDVQSLITQTHIANMSSYNKLMKEALDSNNFDRYYTFNLMFHDTYLDLSTNKEALRLLTILKQRLYDFPRKKEYVPDWEYNSLKEHDKLIELLNDREFEKAGLFIKDVHWSFEVQKPYIMRYYFSDK
ncbi:GntR family transcriptional regulator [Hippea jasoniae]|uniref:GntR family transcriptional regulator n=1 Tax=Hippea jasoniae TaxID=944479 RepID=UPI000551B096|nr:GntR family transcriptional regulator [Hippea jasoniae]